VVVLLIGYRADEIEFFGVFRVSAQGMPGAPQHPLLST